MTPPRKPDLFAALIEPRLAELFRVSVRLARHRQDAEDLVQDSCIVAMQNLSALESAEHPDRWLVRVLYNRFIDGVRGRRSLPVVPLDAHPDAARPACREPGPDELAELADRERTFLRASGANHEL
jgi:DNA-directed RNA polymerase specialized sigma24 family protein